MMHTFLLSCFNTYWLALFQLLFDLYIHFRVLDFYWQKGGNAANSSTVLSLLGAKSEYMGSFANDNEMRCNFVTHKSKKKKTNEVINFAYLTGKEGNK